MEKREHMMYVSWLETRFSRNINKNDEKKKEKEEEEGERIKSNDVVR